LNLILLISESTERSTYGGWSILKQCFDI